MSHTITELREHLFATLKDLRNRDNPMDIDRAKAVVAVAGAVIDSAKVEVDFARVTGATHTTNFIPQSAAPTPMPRDTRVIARSSLDHAIEDVLSAITGELTHDALHARLIELLKKPLPDLDDVLERLEAEGLIRATRVGQRFSYRWTGQARAA